MSDLDQIEAQILAVLSAVLAAGGLALWVLLHANR